MLDLVTGLFAGNDWTGMSALKSGFGFCHLQSPTRHRGQGYIGFGLRMHFNHSNIEPFHGRALQRRPAGQLDGPGNLAAVVAADRALPAAVAKLVGI